MPPDGPACQILELLTHRAVRHRQKGSHWRRGNASPLMTPLKIGILGAARTADDGIVNPSRVLGHRLVAVAARDRSRAEAFAAQRGVENVHQTYAEVIDDPEVEVVYNALVNSLHAHWNQYALNAGEHVLSEKPFARNAAEASLVCNVARTAPGQIVEGFHYLHHR
jgi:predicted dehydrogenase